MIVAVIRHAKVDMKWKSRMTSAEYDKGCADYDAAPVLPVTVNLPPVKFQKIYHVSAEDSRLCRRRDECGLST